MSDDDRFFTSLLVEMNTTTPFKMPSGVQPCFYIIVNKSNIYVETNIYKNKLNGLKPLQMHHPFHHALVFLIAAIITLIIAIRVPWV